MTIKLVSFDLDDTLWDNFSIITEAESDMVQWLGDQVPTFIDKYHKQASEARSRILEIRPHLRFDLNSTRMAVLQAVLLRCSIDPEKAYELAKSALCIFHGRRNRFLYIDGAEALLQELSEQYFLASITNGTAEIGLTSIQKYFDVSLSASAVRSHKPEATLFLMVLFQAGVKPHEAVHVGDHPVDDIEGATKVGMNTIQLQWEHHGHKREVSPCATRVVHDLASIPQALREISASAIPN